MPRAGLWIKQKGCPQWPCQTAAGKCSKLEHFSDATELQCFRGYGHCSCCTGPDLLLWPARLSNSRSGESGRRVAAAGCNPGPSQTKPAQQTTGNVRNCTSLSLALSPRSGLGEKLHEGGALHVPHRLHAHRQRETHFILHHPHYPSFSCCYGHVKSMWKSFAKHITTSAGLNRFKQSQLLKSALNLK